MRSILRVLAILFVTCVPSDAQTGLTGTWRVQSTPPFEVVLRVNGTRLTGRVSQCAMNVSAEIFDGAANGNTVTFKCTSADGDRTVTFTGIGSGDEMGLTWTLEVRAGGSRTDRNAGPVDLFAPSAPTRLTARRVPDGRLAADADRVRGMEFAGAVNLVKQDLKGEAMLFLPQGVRRVRAVLVVNRWGLGLSVYDDPEWRRLAETLEVGILRVHIRYLSEPNASLIGAGQIPSQGAADSFLMLLRRLAEDSGHQELTTAPLLFWGHSSGGGTFGLPVSLSHRTAGFVRYHSGGQTDAEASSLGRPSRTSLNQIPALILVGAKDDGDQGERRWRQSEAEWRSRRSVGAPWTFAVEPEATHGDQRDLTKANALVIPWIAGVLRQRLSPDGLALRVVRDDSAWLGSNRTGEVSPSDAFQGSKADASWLPDEATARGWRIVIGATK